MISIDIYRYLWLIIDSYLGSEDFQRWPAPHAAWESGAIGTDSMCFYHGQFHFNHMGMDQYLFLYHIFRGIFTSILTQLFWCEQKRGTIGFDTLPYDVFLVLTIQWHPFIAVNLTHSHRKFRRTTALATSIPVVTSARSCLSASVWCPILMSKKTATGRTLHGNGSKNRMMCFFNQCKLLWINGEQIV